MKRILLDQKNVGSQTHTHIYIYRERERERERRERERENEANSWQPYFRQQIQQSNRLIRDFKKRKHKKT